MSNDFITLACPTCGGKLNFSSNTISLTCPNCGNEHLVRHDATNITLESYARCPVCGRNDEVKKVSAILANQTQSMQGVTLEKSSYRDKDGNLHTSTDRVPFSGTQSSILAMKLKAPVQPQTKGKPSWAWWLRYFVLFYTLAGFGVGILSCLMLPIAAFSRTVDLNAATDWTVWIGYFALISASFLLGAIFIFPFVWLNKKYKKKNDSYNQEVKRVQEQEYPKWQRATERWKKMYYCFRDDCVFIPGEKTFVETDSINEYVYQIT